jgi:NAD(P)-dependent dehydrogenase (short-subunit alcohol dehydrogenase family)
MANKKTALIYGGRSPIAIALCRELAESGYAVHLVSRTRDKEVVELAKQSGCADVVECDLENTDESVRLASSIDGNANDLDAVAFVHRYRDPNPDPLRQFVVEVLTPYKILEALAERNRKTECSVVITTSPAATRVVKDQDFFYHASKAALNQLVRYSSIKFAPKKIRINGVEPGSFIIKPRSKKYYEENPEKLMRIENSIPSSRIGTPEELASVFSFFLSPKSTFIRGQLLAADGGLSVLAPDALIKP